MNPLRHILAILLAAMAITANAQSDAPTASNVNFDEPVVFVDSLTSAKYVFPEGTRQFAANDDARFVAQLPNGNYLYLYSYKNKKSEPYLWSDIAQGEAKRYADMVDQQRVNAEGLQGWHRQYQYVDDKGQQQHQLITTLRGNDNATYIYEYAPNAENWLTPEILTHSDAPKFTKRTGKMRIWGLFVLLAIALSCMAFPGLRKQSFATRIGVCLGVGALLFIAMAWLTTIPYWDILICCLCVFGIWFFFTREKDDVYFMNTIVKKILDNID